MTFDESMWTRSDEAFDDRSEAILVQQWLRGVRRPVTRTWRPQPSEAVTFTRKSVGSLSDAEKTAFIAAYRGLCNSGWLAPYIELHRSFMMQMHGTMPGLPRSMKRAAIQRFLAWHRLYVSNFERQLGVAVPYWPWRTYRIFPGLNDGSMSRWLFDFKPDIKDSSGNIIRTVVRDDATIAVPASAAHPLPTSNEVSSAMMNNLLNFIDPNPAVDGGGFSEAIEWIHNDVHIWVGGTMLNVPVAPSDPVFWMHHAEIDRIWRTWTVVPFVGDGRLRVPSMGGADITLAGLTLPGGGTAHGNDVIDNITLGYDYDTLN